MGTDHESPPSRWRLRGLLFGVAAIEVAALVVLRFGLRMTSGQTIFILLILVPVWALAWNLFCARFRFGLRWMIATLTLAAVASWLLGIPLHRAYKQRRAVETITAAGGQVSYLGGNVEGGWVRVGHGAILPEWTIRWFGRDLLLNVRAVSLHGEQDAIATQISALREMHEIHVGVWGDTISPGQLKQLANSPHVAEIILQMDFSDEHAAALAGSPVVIHVMTGVNSTLTLRGWRDLSRCRNVARLTVSSSNFGPAEMAAIAEWPITWLAFEPSAVGITDEALAWTPKFAELVGLQLNGPNVTDAGLDEIAGCRKLRYLNLGTNPRLSGAAVQSLADQLPQCDIRWNGQSFGPMAR